MIRLALRDRMESEQLQRRHFDRMAQLYEAHYDDPTSAAYRRRFIHGPLFDGIDLAGARVLEALCGSGQTTPTLLERGASVTGIDISRSAIDSFERRWPQCRGLCASILESGLEDESFDCVVVEAGLHHMHPHLERCMDELHRLLVPGGILCFAEPHSGSFFDALRRVWYRRDAFFADNEEAIDVRALKVRYADRFRFRSEHYLGNVAYFGVLQSMVLRIPLGWKRYYAPLLFPIEALLTPLQGRFLSCMVTCQWQKLG